MLDEPLPVPSRPAFLQETQVALIMEREMKLMAKERDNGLPFSNYKYAITESGVGFLVKIKKLYGQTRT